ncbi:MAG: aldehyde dehydrogenase family protein, partial [Limisphaerales bacterium]
IANESEFGLSGSVWTADVEAGIEIGRRIETGNFSINHFSMDIAAPFGGYKQSGIGRDLGMHALDGYSEIKNIFIAED